MVLSQLYYQRRTITILRLRTKCCHIEHYEKFMKKVNEATCVRFHNLFEECFIAFSKWLIFASQQVNDDLDKLKEH
ncbi:hypothetical protein RCL_jg9675.t1 [Rhizophagus clarus]|uniref:Uncharacterized protein n=1 Tax=Rhizophagus clarus TaxID=94130 RepID=A0A8H3QX38_9GLOM|nr:hypothetical protein RCL_jg9675.t1 [Rhizophagus clarus]